MYSGFGRTLDQVNNSSNSPASRFTSQAFDEDTGLCYYESRYYDPELGRFIQPDTIYPDLFDPQMLNRYSYVGNNPISYTDPTGHADAHFFLSSSGASSARHSSLLSGPANASSQSTFSIFFQNVRANWWGDTRGFLRGVGNAGIGLAQTAGSFLSNPVGFTNQTVAGFSGALGSFSGDPRGFTNNIMEAAYASATTSEGIGGITFGALTAIAGGQIIKGAGFADDAARLNAAKSVDKAWKLKIHGSAQKTGTPGHQFRTYREAIAEAKNPDVIAVHLDHGYNRALGLDPKTISPNRRPDVLSINNDGTVRRIEVQSRTDVPAVLRSRNSALDQQLIDQGFTPTPPVVVRPR